MSGWETFSADTAKLLAGFALGLVTIWFREPIVKRIDRKRKQRALWETVAVEVEALEGGVARLKWLRDVVRGGKGAAAQYAVSSTSSELAKTLVDLDPKNARTYLALVNAVELAGKASEVLGKDLETWTLLKPDERAPHLGLVEGQIVNVSRTAAGLVANALTVLRVLREELGIGDDEHVLRAEALRKETAELKEVWTREYMARIGHEGAP